MRSPCAATSPTLRPPRLRLSASQLHTVRPSGIWQHLSHWLHSPEWIQSVKSANLCCRSRVGAALAIGAVANCVSYVWNNVSLLFDTSTQRRRESEDSAPDC